MHTESSADTRNGMKIGATPDETVPVASGPPKRTWLRALRLAARRSLMSLQRAYYVRIWGMDIDKSAWFSLKAHFDRTHPRGIHVGPESYVAFGAVILSHDMTRGIYADTRVGARCFIGAHSILMPGVSVGDESIVGAGSVVVRDVPPNSIVAGNPARIVRRGIRTFRFGCLWNWE
jgi:acetyltransferase-like isoleucine patch superfamily enzyme